MRARILWAAALALLLFALALGPSALAGAAEILAGRRPASRPRAGPRSHPCPRTCTARRAPLTAPTPTRPAATPTRPSTPSTGTTRSTSGGTRIRRRCRPRWRWRPPSTTRPRTAIYVFGGKDVDTGEVSAATRVFDITANTWTSAASMPEPRASMAAGYNSANGRIYLVGGYSGDDPSSAETTAWEYNPANNMFSTRAPIPHAVGGAAAGVVNGEFLVAGGRNAAGEIVDLVWAYSSTTNAWTARPHLPSPTTPPAAPLRVGSSGSSEARLRRARARRLLHSIWPPIPGRAARA